jgi:N-acetyl-alpha-D-muramate 1-phosphate uridylyltransferase
MSAPRTAMVMAAGLGTRMRPLTDSRPKALIEVAGKALIDHVIDPLVEVGVERVVVNVHAFADAMEAHLKARRDVEVRISDERARLLETGGGIKHARGLLGEDPIFVCNSDYVWMKPGRPALEELAAAWDPSRMDVLLTVIPKDRTLGFDTPGDFFQAPDGTLTHRGAAAEAPLHCFGIEIIDPALIYIDPREAFTQRDTWLAASARKRLHGLQFEGLWMQVGDPAALKLAEARLK